MPDRRQVLRAIVLGGAALAVPAACGLPSGSRPIVDGPAPPAGPGTSGNDVQAPVPGDATDPGGLVKNFLGAVAGKLDVDTDFGKANERAKAFLTAKAQRTWPSGSQVTVVRVVSGPTSSAGEAGETFVDVQLQSVGTLRNGMVTPVSNGAPAPPVQVRFTVVLNDQQPGSYLIDEISAQAPNGGTPLSGMLLNSDGLNNDWYAPQLIYFWSTDSGRKGLVPDLRYVPRVGLSQESQRTEIVNWVLGGPSDLLENAVANTLYAGITLVGPSLVPPDSNGLLINLSAAPQGLEAQQVMDQLRWSLRPFYEGPVRLQENSQNVKVEGASSRYLKSNLADEPYHRGDDTAYCVVGGVVREVTNPDKLPQALTNTNRDNRNVRYAALSGTQPYAALVKTDNWLYVGGVYRDNAQPVFIKSDLTGTAWTRPVFLPSDDPVVMVAVDGRLYWVNLQGNRSEVPIADHPVTAFAVAPDGHRMAMIAGGSAWVCSLRTDEQGISTGPPRCIVTGLTGLTGIAWSQLDRVLIAGRGSANYQLAEATVDGAIAETWSVAFSYKITQVVALPRLPSSTPGVARAMVQTDHNIAYSVSPSHFEPIKLSNPGGSPSPTASSGHASGGEPVLTNPFYLD